MNEWEKVRLGDVCNYTSDRVSIKTLTLNTYISTENMLADKAGVQRASSLPATATVTSYKYDSILISNIRPYFKKIWFASKIGGCSNDVLCIEANELVNSKYLYYMLSQDYFFDYMMSGSKGSKMPRGDKQQIMEFELDLPPLDKQKRIADILGSLDDKIELNNKINSNLESQAQALFKRWFVDFEFPDANGNPYKSSGGEFIDSELGGIPKGWDVLSISEIIKDVNTGGDAIQKTPMVDYDTGVKCIRVGDFTNNRNVNEWGFSKVSDKIYNQYKLNCGNILITRTASIGLVRYIHNNIEAVYNNGIIRIIIDEEIIHSLYVYCYLRSNFFSDHISKITGETSVRPNMKINYVTKFKLLKPNKITLDKYISIVSSIYLEIESNISENQRLINLRNTLLPKLMNNEIKL